MVEAGASEVAEDVILEAIMFGHNEIIKLVEFQEKIIAEVGKAKMEIPLFQLDEALTSEIQSKYDAQLTDAIQTKEKHEREDAINAVKNEVIEAYTENEADADSLKQVKGYFKQYGKRRSS